MTGALKYWDGIDWVTVGSGPPGPPGPEGPQGPPGPGAVTPLVTVLPAAPADGDEVYFQADAANSIVWRLRYNAGSASAYKWEYLGGSPLQVGPAYAPRTSVVYATWDPHAEAGSLTAPLAGDYSFDYGASICNYATTLNSGRVTMGVNGANSPNAELVFGLFATQYTAAGNVAGSVVRKDVPAGALIQLMVRVMQQSGGPPLREDEPGPQVFGSSVQFNYVYIRMTPVRVG